jgi:hypothetical protein
METLKKGEEVQQPDVRSVCYVRLDTGQPVTFLDRYSQIAAVQLNPTSYFKTLYNGLILQ